jgi:hypothetical protein
MWGQTVQAFSDSNDEGRDAAFHGAWTNKGGETLSGSFTVQCKFTANEAQSLTASGVKQELLKAKELAKKGLCDNYILFSNAKLSGRSESAMRKLFLEIPGIKHFVSYGHEAISGIIAESTKLRMLVPRLYGLLITHKAIHE